MVRMAQKSAIVLDKDAVQASIHAAAARSAGKEEILGLCRIFEGLRKDRKASAVFVGAFQDMLTGSDEEKADASVVIWHMRSLSARNVDWAGPIKEALSFLERNGITHLAKEMASRKFEQARGD